MPEKTKFKNKDKVEELQDLFYHRELLLKDMPKDVLLELLICAVTKIDQLEVEKDNEFDERDIGDIICDQEFIVNELFEDLMEKVDLGLYE